MQQQWLLSSVCTSEIRSSNQWSEHGSLIFGGRDPLYLPWHPMCLAARLGAGSRGIVNWLKLIKIDFPSLPLEITILQQSPEFQNSYIKQIFPIRFLSRCAYSWCFLHHWLSSITSALRFVWCFPMSRLRLWVFGRQITEVKCHLHHNASRIHTINIISDCWCWPWSSGWANACHVSLLKSIYIHLPSFQTILFKRNSLWCQMGARLIRVIIL